MENSSSNQSPDQPSTNTSNPATAIIFEPLDYDSTSKLLLVRANRDTSNVLLPTAATETPHQQPQPKSSSCNNNMSNLTVMFVVDVSGSMGYSAATFLYETIPSIVDRFHLSEDQPLELVTFSSGEVHVKTTARLLANMKTVFYIGGKTMFAGAVKIVDRLLALPTTTHALVFVLSDGDINDPVQVASTNISSYGKPVSVVSIRAISKSSADVTAMCRIQQISNQSVPMLFWDGNVKCNPSFWDEIDMASKTLSLESNTREMVRIEHARLCRFPFETESSATLDLAMPSVFVVTLSDEEIASQVVVLNVDGVSPTTLSLTNIIDGPIHSQYPLAYYLAYFSQISHKIAYQIILGNTAVSDSMINWLERLKMRLERGVALSTNSTGGRTMSRVETLHKLLYGDMKSINLLVSQLKNKSHVDLINNVQKADFLRQFGDRRNDRATARISQNIGDPLDFLKKDVTRLANVVLDYEGMPVSRPNMPFTMYHLMDCTSIFTDTKQIVAENLLDQIDNPVLLLKTLGGVGLPFYSKERNFTFPCPWDFSIDTIYTGTGIFLSEAEVIENLINNVPVELPYMRDAPVTGVLPLLLAGSEEYTQYVKNSPFGVAGMHASVAMRRSIACVPWTFAAMIGAGAVAMLKKHSTSSNMIQQQQQQSWTGFDQEILDSLLLQLEMSTASWVSANAFGTLPEAGRFFLLTPNDQTTPSPVPYNNGAICAFLCRQSYRENPDMDWRGLCLRSILEYCIVQRVRAAYKSLCRSGGPDDANVDVGAWANEQLFNLLGVKPEFVDMFVGKPFTEISTEHEWKETDMILPNPTVDLGLLETFVPRDLLLVFYSLAILLPHSEHQGGSILSSDDDDKENVLERLLRLVRYQLDPLRGHEPQPNDGLSLMNRWLTAMVATSLMYFNEEARTAHKKDVVYETNIDELLAECNRTAYNTIYKCKKEERQKIEAAERVIHLVRLAVFDTVTVDDYIKALTLNFADRGKAGVDKMEEFFKQNDETTIPSYLDKLFVFLTGHHPLPSHDVCWNSGVAISSKRVAHFRLLFEDRGAHEMWLAVLQFATKLGGNNAKHKHEYRASKNNRHGYGILLPSFFHYGYRTLEQMREMTVPVDWLAFLEERMLVERNSSFSHCRGPRKYLAFLIQSSTATQAERELYVKMTS